MCAVFHIYLLQMELRVQREIRARPTIHMEIPVSYTPTEVPS